MQFVWQSKGSLSQVLNICCAYFLIFWILTLSKWSSKCLWKIFTFSQLIEKQQMQFITSVRISDLNVSPSISIHLSVYSNLIISEFTLNILTQCFRFGSANTIHLPTAAVNASQSWSLSPSSSLCAMWYTLQFALLWANGL